MILRYTRKEMGDMWTDQKRFHFLLEVEKAVAQVQGQMQIIPQDAAKDIQHKSDFSIERILEVEKTTKHDVIAFINVVAEKIGKNGSYLHYGLTSSDVLDTALSLQIRQAHQILQKGISQLETALKKQSLVYATTLCAGRTHGMHAQPTTFGFKLAGHFCELKRHKKRLEQAIRQCCVCKLSGAVGTYSTLSENVEVKVAQHLKLQTETVATQVIPRDRHAEVILALAQYSAGIERLAVELRHLQKTEVGEVYEGFTSGQQGSSAMPHKKNPIGLENLTGVARILRSYAISALENIILWHERDISHSCVERVIFPDGFILLDYAIHRMADIVEHLVVDSQRMRENMDISQGQMFSSQLLLALLQKGLSRPEAYNLVQKLSHGLQKGQNLKDVFSQDSQSQNLLSQEELNAVFSCKDFLEGIKKHIQKALS